MSAGLSLTEQVDNLNHGRESKDNKPYYHNDIKPENVVINENKDVSLIDFGGACEPRASLEDATLGYMAPELVFASKKIPSAQSDTYSLGQTLQDFLPKKSRLQHTARLMCARQVENRPSKAIVTIDFLTEIYKNKEDEKTLKAEINRRHYPPKAENLQQAWAISALLAASNTNSNLTTEENIKAVLDKNSDLANALSAAYHYLNSGSFGITKAHGKHGKEQAKKFIRNVVSLQVKDRDNIKKEMSRWVKGYGLLGRKSNLNDSSRIRFVSQTGFFSQDGNETSYLSKNKAERKAELSHITSFHVASQSKS